MAGGRQVTEARDLGMERRLGIYLPALVGLRADHSQTHLESIFVRTKVETNVLAKPDAVAPGHGRRRHRLVGAVLKRVLSVNEHGLCVEDLQPADRDPDVAEDLELVKEARD